MSLEKVTHYLSEHGVQDRILVYDVSSATVYEASAAAGVEPARIAKTLSFYDKERIFGVLVVTSGDAKVDNLKFKARFGYRPKMLDNGDVERLSGHEAGAVCPFANPEETKVYMDVSLKRFATVFPACGSLNSAIELTIDELFIFSKSLEWVDVCRDWSH